MSKSKLSVLAAALSEKSGLSMEDAEKFIRQMFDVANDALRQDKIVKMKWLGTFKVQSVKDRESIDVNTGERILIEGRDKISFTPDTVLKEIVNKPFAQFETVVVNDGVDFSAIDEKFAKMEAEDKSTALQENDSPIQKQVTDSAQAPDDSSAKETTNSVNETESVSANNKNEETSTDDEASSGINTSSEVNASPKVLVFGDDGIVPEHPCIADDVVVISDQNGVITISSDFTSSPEEKEGVADVIVVGGETEKQNEIKTSEEVDNSGKPDVSEEKEEVSEETEKVLGKPKNEVETAKLEAETETEKSKVGAETSDAKTEISDANVTKLEAEAERTSESTESEFSESTESAESNELNEAAKSSEATRSGETEETEEADSQASRHFIVPKYMVAIASVVFVALVGGGCWFAFNYGKKSVLNDVFALQADKSKTTPAVKSVASKTAGNQDSAQLILQQKAKQDSIRLAEANKAIKLAEEAEVLKEQSKNKNASNELAEGTSKGTLSETAAIQKQKEKQLAERAKAAAEKVAAERAAAEKAAAKAKAEKALADKLKADKAKAAKDAKSAKSAEVNKPSKYDSDPRVRTGAYRIIGVAQTVTVKPGQTLAGISKTYLGSGMECYVEAINGGAEVKAGQKIKIPKLELKKKSKANK